MLGAPDQPPDRPSPWTIVIEGGYTKISATLREPGETFGLPGGILRREVDGEGGPIVAVSVPEVTEKGICEYRPREVLFFDSEEPRDVMFERGYRLSRECK